MQTQTRHPFFFLPNLVYSARKNTESYLCIIAFRNINIRQYNGIEMLNKPYTIQIKFENN